jgi:NhaP-type Na+/H+ or K+/H+ antiporter
MDPVLLMALIGALGIGSQWLAWRLSMPAIVLMLAAGVIAGPVMGAMNPEAVFGDLFRPLIAIAGAVILFEGGLTLNFHEIRETGKAVRRLVYVGAPLAWLFSGMAVYYGAGLSLESSAVFGGILIVTGPTVIMPLLRQARLAARPASMLRWEAIINDAVGALAAVLAFEVITALSGASSFAEAAKHFLIGISVAGVAGYVAGRFIVFTFLRGYVPEYMKVPVLFAVLLLVYALTDMLLHESGLLAVTIMGMVLGNAHLPSLSELRRFKEHVTVILVSGVFIMLAASLNMESLTSLSWRAVLFCALIIFVARPLAVMLSLVGTTTTIKERGIVGWVGPRGVVAVAVSGLFGSRLVELGIEDGAALAPLAFALVAATVVIHGFSMVPVARWLGLMSTSPPGVIIVGASKWAVALGAAIKSADLPVLMADGNYWRLRRARNQGIRTFHGEILSEAAEMTVPMNQFGTVIAATENDAYNALICTDFGPEFGRNNVFQVGRHEADENDKSLPVTIGGRRLGRGMSYERFSERLGDGEMFTVTKLTEEYGLEAYRDERRDVEIIAIVSSAGEINFASANGIPNASAGDRVIGMSARPVEPDEAAK